MPTARVVPGVGVVNGILYAVGGHNGSVLKTNEAYDPVTNTWIAKSSMLTAHYGARVGVVNDILYAIGGSSGIGCSGSNLGTAEAYDPVANAWVAKASMPTARCAAAAAVVNGIIYVVGGNNGSLLATVEAYDPTSNLWTTKASMPTARQWPGAEGIDGILYVVGGGDNSGIVSTVEAYDPASNTWTTKASMPTARFVIGTGVVNGILYVVGGAGNSGDLATVEGYDPAANTWTTVAPMPTARNALGAGVVNNVLYALGGANSSSSYLATNEAFTPAPVGKADQTINFGPLSNRAFGDPPFAISASASSGLPVSFSASGSCTVSGTTVSLTGVGNCTITADQAGDDDFNPAPSVQQSFAVLYNSTVGHSFLQPINMPPQSQSVFRIGSTIPVKFRLFLADGVTPVSTAVATIQVNKVSSGVPSPVNETVTSTVPNQGVTFRYDAGSQQYIFNLSTKSWSAGNYVIVALLDDGSQISVVVGAR
jgi:hypothetical protein